MSGTLTGFAYLISSVLFILALRGLSSPETARQGNIFGIAGMVIAVVTTLAAPSVVSFELIVLGIVIGGAAGTIIARKIEMTALPQLVAAFHSLVGLAAVFVAVAAFYTPEAYVIGKFGDIHMASIIELSLGLAIGAITFSGSVIAFEKLHGIMSGNPITFKNFSGSKSMVGLLSFIFPTIENLLASPPQMSSIKHIPSSNPNFIESGSIPLSNLYFASVLISKILEVFLIDEGKKYADSNKMFLVNISVPDLVPPIIPPRPKTPDLSLIAHMLF